MLVLSRRKGESVTLELPDGTTMEIQVQKIQTFAGVCVQLGFEVPKDVIVSRTEARKVRRSKKEAAKT